ncbi:MAG: tRNA uridine-5-carboxymethylaminomethyl(34) synthesis GTPase MnmE [Bacteroidia bacterium]|nr:tRNA uridine-5-carboxymethylaminomethyl(34) synthesis GTPase MnmE [Bacteroidia bacterium]
MKHFDTIAAISTPNGLGAIGVIRVSGKDAISLVNNVFSGDLMKVDGYRMKYGRIIKAGKVLDEVVVGIFRAPNSFTREDVVEISCHGSPFILREVMELLVEQGIRPAEAGEFTQRAFLNGAMDLSQAEAVADLIASSSAASHRLAMNQLRGGISKELSQLRERLLNFVSLIELELDFGEEDVEFADRTQLEALIKEMLSQTGRLISSFQLGNALKQGVPTAIIGKPNAGKSTLLNALLQENRAIVSDIPGTTRDVIEDRMVIEGIEFRLMDTAGVRETTDTIEKEGVHRTLNIAQRSSLIMYIFDLHQESPEEAQAYVNSLQLPSSSRILYVGNKLDLMRMRGMHRGAVPQASTPGKGIILISAKEGSQLDNLKSRMVAEVNSFSEGQGDQALISNVRHLNALKKAHAALEDVERGMASGLSGDLLSIDIRTVLHYVGEITGEISTDEVLGNIFGKFCIGK